MRIARKLWHKPHPCGVCGTMLTIAYPTCADKACRKEWRRASQRASAQACREWRETQHPEFCRYCKKKMTELAIESGYKSCHTCRKKLRLADEKRKREKAYNEYVQRLSLARADRIIADRKREIERIDREANAYIEAKYGPLVLDEIPVEEI